MIVSQATIHSFCGEKNLPFSPLTGVGGGPAVFAFQKSGRSKPIKNKRVMAGFKTTIYPPVHVKTRYRKQVTFTLPF